MRRRLSRAWMSAEVLDWFVECTGGSVVERNQYRRAYEHFQRAEYFLRQPSGSKSFDLADCVANLRKCLTNRIQLIERLYRLRSALREPSKRPYLDVLADIGVVRPSLLRTLLRVRNAIEYKDAQPPKLSRCEELVDAVWYFLRATDSLVATVREDLHVTPPGEDPDYSPYGLSVGIAYLPKFKAEFFGVLPLSHVVFQPTEGWLMFRVEKFERNQNEAQREPNERIPSDGVFVVGKFADLTLEQRRTLIAAGLTAL